MPVCKQMQSLHELVGTVRISTSRGQCVRLDRFLRSKRLHHLFFSNLLCTSLVPALKQKTTHKFFAVTGRNNVVISQTQWLVSQVRLPRWCESLCLLYVQHCHLSGSGFVFTAGVSHHTPPPLGGAGLVGLYNQF